MNVILANPRGFCAGVDRAISIVERALEIYGAPVYVRHEIVHNKHVVERLRSLGAVFVKEVDEIPNGAITIFSAHGVSQKIEDDSALRDLQTIDATCPLVKKVHLEAIRSEQRGAHVILIGHAGHPEVEGTSGRVQQSTLISTVDDVARLDFPTDAPLAYVTQTTLSLRDTRAVIEALKEKYPQITGQDDKDICYATQNRQNAVEELAAHTQLILVVGAVNSSNSNRLRDLAIDCGAQAHLISCAEDIEDGWLEGVRDIGVTAGASAPESLVQGVVEHLQRYAMKSGQKFTCTQAKGAEENVSFKLPPQVRSREG